MKPTTAALTSEELADAQLLWEYHHLRHAPRPSSVAVGLGSHDLGVATTAAALYSTGLAPLLLFSGANSPTTRARFPRGEAVHYREHVLELGVPESAVLVETQARNTGENIQLSRKVLADAGVEVSSVLLVTKPYEERRAYATACQLWPDVEFACVSEGVDLEAYLEAIGDARLVVDMIVGTFQRILLYPKQGFMAEQHVPGEVLAAYERLALKGFDSRLIPEGKS